MEARTPDTSLDDETRARLERLKSGCILLARDELKDPNFDKTVILLCVYGEEGSYGVVINRQSHMPLSEIFDGFGGIDQSRKVYIGGPVRQDELQIIQITDNPADNALEIAPHVHLGGQWDDLQRILDTDEADSYLFLGYSGWAPGQLEYEVIVGAWEVYNVDLVRFLQEPEEHWRDSADRMAEHLRRLQA